MQQPALATIGHLPEAKALAAPKGETAAVWAKVQTGSRSTDEILTADRIPQPCRAVLRSRGEQVAHWAEGQRHHPLLMPLQDRLAPPLRRVPDVYVPIIATGRQQPAIRTPGQSPDIIGVIQPLDKPVGLQVQYVNVPFV